MANQPTNKELLIGLDTDMQWVKKSLSSYKTVAVGAKDRSLKNENDIKNFKYFVGIFTTIIVLIGQGIAWLFKRTGG